MIGEIVGSKATGEVVGDLGGTLVMDKIDATQQVVLGEEVVTAGLTLGEAVRSPYPKGLVIGRIIDVTRDPNAVVQTAFVDPAIDLVRLEALLVITDYEGGIPSGDILPTDDLNPDGTLPDSEQPFATRAPTPRPTPRRRRSRRRSRRRGPDAGLGCYDRRTMKGLILAGGTATRLFPLTIVTNKHLLPIYDRPMIYYPLETLAGMGIREVLVIVGGKSVGDVVELLGDGTHFGLSLTYRYQGGALGIAHAIGLAREFVGDDPFCCVLGDNILSGPPLEPLAREFAAGTWGAGTLLYQVADPERFGVAELDAAGRVVGFEEKPEAPKSNLIPIGVYFLRPDVFDVIDTLAPSGRGEFEITDVLNHYIPQGGLYAPRYEGHWADAGTVPSLLRAAQLAAAADAEGKLAAPPQRPTA